MRTKRTQTRQEEIASGCTVLTSSSSSLPTVSNTSDCISSIGANLRNKPSTSTMLKRSAVSAAAACRENSPAKVLRKPAASVSSTNVTKSESPNVTSDIDKKCANKSISSAKPVQSVITGKSDAINDKKGKKVIKSSDNDKVSMPKVKKLTKKDILKNKQNAAKALATAAAVAAIAATAVTATTSTSAVVELDEKSPSSPKDEKVSKELKNLDIQITGFNSVLKCDSNTSSSDIIIKASISEIVKTKSRTSASQSMYGKSATMTAIANSLITNSNANIIGTNANDNKAIKSNADDVDQNSKQSDESKSDNDVIKPTTLPTKKGKVNRKISAAAKKKALNKKKKESEKQEQDGGNPTKTSTDEADKSLCASASTKKRNSAEKPLPKNKKQKTTENKAAEAQKDTVSDSITQSNLTDIQSLTQSDPVDTEKDTELVKHNEKSCSVKEIEKEAVTATKSKVMKKSAKPKAAAKKLPKKDLPIDSSVSDHNIDAVVDTSQEATSREILSKKPIKLTKKSNVAKKNAKIPKASTISETVIMAEIKATPSETITKTVNPEPKASTSTDELLQDTPMATEVVTDSPASSPKHQKLTKIALGKDSTLKKQQKSISTEDASATKGKIKIACPKKKVLKALKLTGEQDKNELNIDTEPIDCDSEPTCDIVNLPPTNEPLPFESPSILELTEDTSSMTHIENLTNSPENPLIHVVSTGQLSDLISKSDQSPNRSQSNIKKMVEDILQVLEMSDEFSGNETGEKKLTLKSNEKLSEEELPKEINAVKKSKPVKPKAIKVPKPKTKKPMETKGKSDSVIPVATTEIETPKEDASSDEPLSELVKPDTKPEVKSNNADEPTSTEQKDEEKDDEEKEKKSKITAQKKIPMVNKSQIAKRKYVRRKPKSPTALQKMVDKAVKKKQKLTLTEAEISSLDCVDDYSRTKDIYDFHESGHSSEDTSLSYKKNIKKDTKLNELKFDFDSKDPLEISDTSLKNVSIGVKTEAVHNADEVKHNFADKKQVKETKTTKKESSPIKTIKEKPKELKVTKASKKSAAAIKKKDVPVKATKKKKSPNKPDKSSQSASDSEPIPKKKMTTEKETKSKIKQAQAKKAKQKKVMAKKSKTRYSSNESDSDDDDDDSSDGDEVLAKKYYKTKNLTSSTSNTSESESGSCTSVRTRVNKRRKAAVKNRRMRLFGFYSGPKRHRMASLNALAKVQCLYENESRTAQELGFVREPRVVPKVTSAKLRAPVVIVANENDDASDSNNENMEDDNIGVSGSGKKKTIPKDPLSETDVKIECEVIGSRSLRTAPGIRGAGKLWEMGNMSSMESNTGGESDESYEQVSFI